MRTLQVKEVKDGGGYVVCMAVCLNEPAVGDKVRASHENMLADRVRRIAGGDIEQGYYVIGKNGGIIEPSFQKIDRECNQ